jgi:hypothetical protein
VMGTMGVSSEILPMDTFPLLSSPSPTWAMGYTRKGDFWLFHGPTREGHTTGAEVPFVSENSHWSFYTRSTTGDLSEFFDIALMEKVVTKHSVSLDERVWFLMTEWAWTVDLPLPRDFVLSFGPHFLVFLSPGGESTWEYRIQDIRRTSISSVGYVSLVLLDHPLWETETQIRVATIVQQCPGTLEALTQDQLDIVGWHLSHTHNEGPYLQEMLLGTCPWHYPSPMGWFPLRDGRLHIVTMLLRLGVPWYTVRFPLTSVPDTVVAELVDRGLDDFHTSPIPHPFVSSHSLVTLGDRCCLGTQISVWTLQRWLGQPLGAWSTLKNDTTYSEHPNVHRYKTATSSARQHQQLLNPTHMGVVAFPRTPRVTGNVILVIVEDRSVLNKLERLPPILSHGWHDIDHPPPDPIDIDLEPFPSAPTGGHNISGIPSPTGRGSSPPRDIPVGYVDFEFWLGAHQFRVLLASPLTMTGYDTRYKKAVTRLLESGPSPLHILVVNKEPHLWHPDRVLGLCSSSLALPSELRDEHLSSSRACSIARWIVVHGGPCLDRPLRAILGDQHIDGRVQRYPDNCTILNSLFRNGSQAYKVRYAPASIPKDVAETLAKSYGSRVQLVRPDSDGPDRMIIR